MPPDSSATARPLVPTGSPPAPSQLAHVHVGAVGVELHAQLEVRPREVDGQRGALLDRGADLPLDLLRGEREGLVAAAHAHRERARLRACERHHADLRDALAVAFATQAHRACRRSRTRAPGGRPPRRRSARRAPGSRTPTRRPRTRASSPRSAALVLRRSASRKCRLLRPFSDASPTFASRQTGAPAGASGAGCARWERVCHAPFVPPWRTRRLSSERPCQGTAVRVDS